MPTLTPTTELEAVNQMLGTILEAPVNSLLNVGSLDAQRAINTLAEVSRDLQAQGWNFNTEEELRLLATASGEILLPLNCISVDTSGPDKDLDLIQRGGRLYDRTAHTFAIGRPVTVDMTVLLAFDELPEPARRYIAVLACRMFQRRSVGSTTLDAFSDTDETRARMAFKRSVKGTATLNIFDSPDMQRMLRR